MGTGHNARRAYVKADRELRDRVFAQWRARFHGVGECILLEKGFTLQ